MKASTAEQRLAALLGIKTDEVPLSHAEPVKAKTDLNKSYAFTAVSETEIQAFRKMQGMLYYLRAPELFTYLKCRHCHEPFMVSRRFVAFCSYTCIIKDCEKQGFEWSKGKGDPELIIKEVYDNNEPLWIRNPEQILNALNRILDLMQREKDYGPQYTEIKDKFARLQETT